MANEEQNTLSIRQITGRSLLSLSLLVVLVLGLGVAGFNYYADVVSRNSDYAVSRLTMTEQLMSNMAQLQVLEGHMTTAALQGKNALMEKRSEKLLDHIAAMADLIDNLVESTATSRAEIKKTAANVAAIFEDISTEMDTLSEKLLSGASVSSQAALYARFNQDVHEFNAGVNQLQKLFVKVIGINNRLSMEQQVFYATVGFVVLLLLFFVFMGRRWNGRLSSSMAQLRDGIERVHNADFSPIEIEAKDEIGATALVFNRTIEKYKEAFVAYTEREATQQNLISFLEVVSEAADGDLTMQAPVTADAFGSIADAYNLMVECLAELLLDTKQNAGNVGEQTKKLIQIFQEMEMGAETQSQQVDKAMEFVQLSEAAAREIAEKAAQAQLASRLVDEVTEKGSELVSDNIEGMQLIRVTVQVINKKMKSLSERLLEIGTISQLISEIATRTTILAMNASIEASRAGEQGRGFLVISDEIKRLADKSTEATKQIGGIIKSIQTEANEVTASLEEETRTVENQSKLAQDTGESFKAIQGAIDQSKTVVTEITELSHDQFEMTRKVEQVMKKVTEIAELTLQQVRSSATIATDLSQQSDELLSSVETFRLPGDDGDGGLDHELNVTDFSFEEDHEPEATVAITPYEAADESLEAEEQTAVPGDDSDDDWEYPEDVEQEQEECNEQDGQPVKQ